MFKTITKMMAILVGISILQGCTMLEDSLYRCPYPDLYNCGLSLEEGARRNQSVNTYESRLAEWQHCKEFDEPWGAYCGMQPRRYE